MNLDMWRLKIAKCDDLEELRRMAILLTKIIPDAGAGGGYKIVVRAEPHIVPFQGSRSECEAFVEGASYGVPDDLTLCVDTPSCMVVEDEGFGEFLVGYEEP